MATADYFVLTLYLFGMIGLGVYYALKNTNLSEMFAAGGASPWWVSGLSGFMTMFSAGTFVVWGGIAYKYGLVAVSINLTYGIAALIVGYFLAARWKNIGLRTPAQFVELRFGKSSVQLYIWMMMIFRIVGCAIALYALAVLICALIPLQEGHLLRDAETGNLSVLWATLIFGGIVVGYTMAGGLWAVLMTDVLQFIVLNLAVLFTVPLILIKTGGLSSTLQALPDGFMQPVGGGYGWLFLLGWVTINFFMIGGEWAFAQRFISVPSAKDAKKSAYLFGFLYLVSPIFWLAPPLLYRAITADAPAEEAYILAAKSVLPVGLVGLMIAAMFSATASLVSSQLNVFAGALTDPVAQKLLKSGGTESKALWIGRGFTALLGVILIILAALVPYMGGAEKVIVSATSLLVGPLIAPSIWGMLTKRVDQKSVWFAFLSAILATVAFYGLLKPEGLFSSIPAFDGISLWASENQRSVNLIIGLVVPNFALALHHFVKKEEAPGVARIAALAADNIGNQQVKASTEPFYVIAVCLGISSLVMFALGVFAAANDKLTLFIFSAILLAIGAAAFVFAKRSNKSSNDNLVENA